MPLGITGTDISGNLSRLLGLQGKFSMAQDEVSVPVISVGDLAHSPYQPFTPCGAVATQAAVALENSYVFVTPTTGMFLVIDEITLSSSGPAGALFTRLTAANLVTLAAVPSIVRLKNFNAVEPASPTGPQLGPVISIATRVGILGDSVGGLSYGGASNNGKTYRFPNGYILDGDDPAGLNALAAVVQGLNLDLQASFVCRIFFK